MLNNYYFHKKEIENLERKLANHNKNSLKEDSNVKKASIQEKLEEIIENHAEKLMISGEPVLSACVHLSVNDGYSAVIKLIRAHYLFEAYILAICLKIDYLVVYLKNILIQQIGKHNLLHKTSKELIKLYPNSQIMANFYSQKKEYLEEITKTVSFY